MQKLFDKAENIELKVKQLISKLKMLKKENAFLKEENNNLVEKLKQQKGKIKELEIKSTNIDSGTPGNLENVENAKIVKQLDNHIEEIDKVIDVLRTY